VDRDMETEIADMLVAQHPLGLSVDYALGGGRCFFLPNTTTGSCRHNSLDPFSDAPQYDRKSDAIRPRMLSTRQEFDALANDSSALGTIGLFSLDVSLCLRTIVTLDGR
jgi:alkaline phosphatase